MTRRTRQPSQLGQVTAPFPPLFRTTSISEYYTDFDGATEYARIDADVFNFTRFQSWSFSWWMRKTGGGITQIAGRQLNASPFPGWAVICRSGAIAVTLTNTHTTNMIEVRSTGFTFFTGSWKMGLVTYNGSGAASGVQIYAGQLVSGVPTFSNVTGSIITDNLTASIQNATSRFSAMARYDTVNGAAAFTSEDLADVRLFPGRVLDAVEGTELYAAGRMLDNNDFVHGDDCDLWWRMGDGDAGDSYDSNTIADNSAGENDGTTVALAQADALLGAGTGAGTWPERAA